MVGFVLMEGPELGRALWGLGEVCVATGELSGRRKMRIDAPTRCGRRTKRSKSSGDGIENTRRNRTRNYHGEAAREN